MGVGPSTSSPHSRPVRSSSRLYYTTNTTNGSSPSTFSGPVRRWEKKWVHVSSSLPSTLKHRKQSRAPKVDKSSLLLCKWTPLSTADADKSSPRRKFRYTPVGTKILLLFFSGLIWLKGFCCFFERGFWVQS